MRKQVRRCNSGQNILEYSDEDDAYIIKDQFIRAFHRILPEKIKYLAYNK